MRGRSKRYGDDMASVVQVELAACDGRRTCWLDTAKRFRVGDGVTLKNSEAPETVWTVLSMSELRDSETIHSDWNVGGVTSRR